MKENFTNNILNPSLELIRQDNKLKKFFFLPGVFWVIVLSLILVYQVAYTYVVLLEKQDDVMQIILSYFHNAEYLMISLIALSIGFILYIIVWPILDGALIRYIATRDEKWPNAASRADALGLGMVRFYPLFEFNSISGLFKFITILNGFLFSLRFLGIEYVKPLAIFFIVAFCFSFVLNTFISYARYEIVLHNAWVFEAIWTSASITLLNLKTTLRIYFLMFIMNIKVLLNFIIFMIFPIIMIVIAGYVSSQIFSIIVMGILMILFFFLLAVLWYMAWVLQIFTTAMWYYAYKEWKKKLKEVSV